MSLNAAQISELLGLSPHTTCGYVRESYRSAQDIPASILPAAYAGPRALGGILYFLVTHQAPVRLHRIRSDQMYHYYLGDPLEVLLLNAACCMNSYTLISYLFVPDRVTNRT